jgi:diguanylate cyclase (GGDEF)-like protein/PAS domain S-box-containing protein
LPSAASPDTNNRNNHNKNAPIPDHDSPVSAFRLLARLAAVLLALAATAVGALALEALRVPTDVPALDLTNSVTRNRSEGDVIQISTAAGADGIVRRIAVRAREAGTRPEWIVFALKNDSDEQIDRLLVAPYHRLVGSGVIWPDLGSTRIESVTASQGLRPEREASTEADVFLITLDPGATVTFVAELTSGRLPQLYLWEPEAYRQKLNGLTLYKGIVIGIAGLLALFLTITFVVKGAVMFPAAAALGWAVLLYAGLDFGFFQRIFPLSPAAERIYRAGAEAVLAGTLLVFLFAYLNLARWHVRYGYVTVIWLLALLGLVALAVYDPPLASGVARLSIAAVAAVGILLVLNLALHGYDRAIMLIPSWLLLGAWVIAAGMTIGGYLTRDLVPPALIGGLVLIVILIGFTVLQHAIAGGGLTPGVITDAERKALALTGAGDVVFDWDVVADKLHVSPELESALGLARGALGGPLGRWIEHLHPNERDSWRALISGLTEQRRGKVNIDMRLRAGSAGGYHWHNLRARPVQGANGEVIRIIGTVTDVTDARIAQERLLHDAVHDNLTGLPNRQLFQDRLEAALSLARLDPNMRPTVVMINIDRFREVNDSLGVAAGDTLLLQLARRLGRIARPQDTLARLTGDGFGMIIMSETAPQRLTQVTNLIRKAVTTPITHAGREVFLTASIGVTFYDGQAETRRELGVAQHRARAGACAPPGRRHAGGLPPGHAHRALGPRGAGKRPAPRAGAGRDHRDVPAHRPAGGPHHRRLRGAAALGSSARRAHQPAGVHPHRGRDRADRRTRRVHAGAHGARARGLAGGAGCRAADLRQRQCLQPPAFAP